MSLKDSTYKAVDLLMCPSRTVDKNGQTPLVNNPISQFLCKAQNLTPLIVSTSVLAIDAVLTGGEYTKHGILFSGGHILSSIYTAFSKETLLNLRSDYLELQKNNIEYYVRKNIKNTQSIDQDILSDLRDRKEIATDTVIGGALAFSVVASPLVITAPFLPELVSELTPLFLGIASPYITEALGEQWRTKRVLDGAWSVSKESPQSQHMMPA